MNITLILILCATALAASTQQATKDAQVSMGHIHFNVTDAEAQKRVWVDLLGATTVKLGDFDVLKLPNLLNSTSMAPVA